jgi:hypothetical protein
LTLGHTSSRLYVLESFPGSPAIYRRGGPQL